MGLVDNIMDQYLKPDDTLSDNKQEQEIVESKYHDSIYIASELLQPLENSFKKGYDIDKPRNLAKSVTVE